MTCCTDSHFPPSEVEHVILYLRQTHFVNTPLDSTTLIFTEAGTACAELTLAKKLIDRGFPCSQIILMDRLYTETTQQPCQFLTKQIAVPITIYKNYESLISGMTQLKRMAVIGLHQRHHFSNPDHVNEYGAFLQACIEGQSNGRLITPYLNFMHCSRLVLALAAHKNGHFIPVPSDGNGHTCVNSKSWEIWQRWIQSQSNMTKVLPRIDDVMTYKTDLSTQIHAA